MAIDLPQITAAAVRLLDEHGLAGLSTRKLAAELGVQSPTLYWHVRNKDELLDLVAEAICAEAFDIDESLPWREQLATGLRQFRTLLRSHRDAAQLLRARPPRGPHRLGHIETTTRILLDAGFSPADTAAISVLLADHVLASAAEDDRRAGTAPRAGLSPPEGFPHLARVAPAYRELTGEALFELGVQVLLDGLAARLSGTA
ncbi:TetR/AcrR family transcriptional regulator C-terminal domain-containing protein [Crossiella sp. CA-258035]|uniref:TetR/AcrR family transcriptional regulator C-terminal domain-containing protein n=1 Tax=Crossiella sp. CA-258035 TaxID=2981138 RepID=UPI0024BCCB0D|nr:TetR/AcrR family transcriptional regulator C-terminal domain-containing protein [Crossiella sp. CA-258035]WHT22028.1 TetR/AcrR family transcriptional regulator C-terminal domain-containing protein [Crossiella sp. CA-258035]